jgi:hypothetical protein
MKTQLTVAAVAVLLAAAIAAAQPQTELPTVEAVLSRFVDAVGGAAALEQRQVEHYQGTIVQDLTWTDPQHQETPFLAEADTEGRVRYAETGAWSDLPDSSATALPARLRWLLHPQFALRIADFFPDLAVSGRELRDGRPVVVLAPRGLKYAYHALFFDEETGLLSHVGYHDDLTDWREADGVLFPRRYVCGRKGGHTTYVFTEVRAGPAPAP